MELQTGYRGCDGVVMVLGLNGGLEQIVCRARFDGSLILAE